MKEPQTRMSTEQPISTEKREYRSVVDPVTGETVHFYENNGRPFFITPDEIHGKKPPETATAFDPATSEVVELRGRPQDLLHLFQNLGAGVQLPHSGISTPADIPTIRPFIPSSANPSITTVPTTPHKESLEEQIKRLKADEDEEELKRLIKENKARESKKTSARAASDRDDQPEYKRDTPRLLRKPIFIAQMLGSGALVAGLLAGPGYAMANSDQAAVKECATNGNITSLFSNTGCFTSHFVGSFDIRNVGNIPGIHW